MDIEGRLNLRHRLFEQQSARTARKVQELELKRASIREQVSNHAQSFQAARGRVLSELSSSAGSSALAIFKLVQTQRALQIKRESLAAARRELHPVLAAHQQTIDELLILRGKMRRIDEIQSECRREKAQQRSNTELEVVTEVSMSRFAAQAEEPTPRFAGISALTATSGPVEFPMRTTISRAAAVREKAASDFTAQQGERLSACQSQEGAAGSCFSCMYTSSQGAQLGLELRHSMAGVLSVLLKPRDERERRLLWAERPKIMRALREAGYGQVEIACKLEAA